MMKTVLALIAALAVASAGCDYSKYATCGSSYSSCVQSNPTSYCDCFGPYVSCVDGAGCDATPVISACKAAGCTNCPASVTEGCDYSKYATCGETYSSCVQKDPTAYCGCFPAYISCVSGAGCPDTGIVAACKQEGCSSC